MNHVKIGYEHSKSIFNGCWKDCIIRYYEIFNNEVPEIHSDEFYKMLASKIKTVKKLEPQTLQNRVLLGERLPDVSYEYSFDDSFLREYIETDNKIFAYILYQDAEDPEIRTFLKMKWAF